MTYLITLDEYKEAEGIQSTKEDTRITSLISSVSALVKTYCGNSIVDHYSADKVEWFDVSWDSHIVQLTESPVNSVSLVRERSSYDGTYTTLTTGDYEYYLNSATDSIFRTTGGSNYKNWPKGPGAVEVTYRAGYSVCPPDLQLGVIDLITYYVKDEHKSRQSIQGASIQNQTSSSQRDNVSFPDHIKRVLDLYKNF
jgi:hypothetical protein